jgi:hypothetical protein
MANEILVTSVTPEQTATYKGLVVGFFDKTRSLPDGKDKDGKPKTKQETRLYISIDLAGRKDHVIRLAKDGETERYAKAYELYLAAKKSGGTLDTATQMLNEIAEKDARVAELEALIAKQEAAKRTKKGE